MRRSFTQLIEIDLVILLAVVVLLGAIVGYSLAAARPSSIEYSIMKIGSDEADPLN